MKKARHIMLALTLMLTTMTTALPTMAMPIAGGINPDTDNITIEPTITKYLQVPVGTLLPEGAEFSFTFEPVAQIIGTRPVPGTDPVVHQPNRILVADLPTTPGTPGSSRPTIPTIHLDMADAQEVDLTALTADELARIGIPAANVDEVIVFRETTESFVATFTPANGWTEPGHFIFHVRETADTNLLPFDHGFLDDIDYSNIVFELHVIVSRVGGVLTVTGLYAWNLGVEENGVFDGDWDGDLESTVGKELDAINFLNTFRRQTTEENCPEDDPDCQAPQPCPDTHPHYDTDCEFILTPPCPEDDPDYPDCIPTDMFNNALTIRKFVTGLQASTSTVFDFDIYIDQHVLDEATSWTAYVWTFVHGNENPVAGGLYPSGWVRGERITLTPGLNTGTGAAGAFQLTHGQMLVFEEMILGTQVNVTELDPSPYSGEVDLLISGGEEISTRPTSLGSDVSTGVFRIRETLLGQRNYAGFLNTFNGVPITGIIADNMPLVLSSAVGIGFLGLVVLNKKRRVFE